MKNKKTLSITLYSYKNKNLKAVVENIIKNTKNTFTLRVIDQNTIDRSKQILKISKNISYKYKQWYDFHGPIFYKNEGVIESDAEFLAIVSDDFYPKDGWDQEVIDYISNKSIIVSGNGMPKLSQKDYFSFNIERSFSESFSLTNFIDRNFIFGPPHVLAHNQYPVQLKYNGEEEAFSAKLYTNGIDIFCAPTSLYQNLKQKTLEKLYTTFSLDHNYNTVIDILNGKDDDSFLGIKRSILDFLNFHNIDISKLHKVPFVNNDVEYDPESLEYGKVDARRFVSSLNTIY